VIVVRGKNDSALVLTQRASTGQISYLGIILYSDEMLIRTSQGFLKKFKHRIDHLNTPEFGGNKKKDKRLRSKSLKRTTAAVGVHRILW
jgi:hypothetical protein